MKPARALGVAGFLLLGACSAPAGDGKSALWAGSLQLCADTVRSVSLEEDSGTDGSVLRVELTEAAGKQLSRMTARLIGEPLEIKLGDKTVTAPIVAERVTGGTFVIAPLSSADIEQVRREIEESC